MTSTTYTDKTKSKEFILPNIDDNTRIDANAVIAYRNTLYPNDNMKKPTDIAVNYIIKLHNDYESWESYLNEDDSDFYYNRHFLLHNYNDGWLKENVPGLNRQWLLFNDILVRDLVKEMIIKKIIIF